MTPTQLDEDRTQAALDSREGCCGMDSPAVRRRRELSPAIGIIFCVCGGLAVWAALAVWALR